MDRAEDRMLLPSSDGLRSEQVSLQNYDPPSHFCFTVCCFCFVLLLLNNYEVKHCFVAPFPDPPQHTYGFFGRELGNKLMVSRISYRRFCLIGFGL